MITVSLSLEDFRGDVIKSAHNGCSSVIIPQLLTKTHIDELQMPIQVEENIIRFHIAVSVT